MNINLSCSLSQTIYTHMFFIFSLSIFLYCILLDFVLVLEKFDRRMCSTTSSPLRVASVLTEPALWFLCVLVRSTEVL